MFCPKCKLVQLKHTVDPVQLYGEDYGYKSGINDTMKKELAEIVWQDKTPESRKIGLEYLKFACALKNSAACDIATASGAAECA